MSASILGSARSYICQIDVVFVVDTSGSIWDKELKHWKLIQDFVKYIVDDLDIDTGSVRVGYVSFATDARVGFTLGKHTSRADVKKAIDNISTCCVGYTNTTGALRLVRTALLQPEAGDRKEVPNIIIVITDGNPTKEVRFLKDEASRIKHMGSRIIAVGVTNKVNMTLLETEIVSKPAFLNSYFVANFEQLAILVDSIAANECDFGDIKNTSCTSALSIVFLLHLASGFHQNTDSYDDMRNSITRLVDESTHLHNDTDVRVGAVSLTGDVVRPLLVTTAGIPFESLKSNLSADVCMKDNDKANVTVALTKARELLNTTSKEGKKAVILITDQQLGEVDASHMEEGAFRLITIGVGGHSPREKLHAQSDHYYVRSYGKLGSTTDDIVQKLCHDQG